MNGRNRTRLSVQTELDHPFGRVLVHVTVGVEDLRFAGRVVRDEPAGHAVLRVDRKPREPEEPLGFGAIRIAHANRTRVAARMHHQPDVTDGKLVGRGRRVIVKIDGCGTG